MKNVLFTLFAIGLAGLAAVAATTAFLNAPVNRQAAQRVETLPIGPPPAGENKPAGSAPADSPAPSTQSDAPAPAANPGAPDAGGAKPAAPTGAEESESDVDPYEGIAPEDLPPDLQYDADSSVSFPTNI
jgi:hypothetical protein